MGMRFATKRTAMPNRNYSDLIAWQKAMTLAERAYRLTQHMPREELYGLTGQIRRAAASIPANVAEGEGRHTRAEFLRFLSIAHGSVRELETHVRLAGNLRFLNDKDSVELLDLCAEVGRLLQGLMNALRRQQ